MPKVNPSLTVSESEEWIFNRLILTGWVMVEMNSIEDTALLEIRALGIMRRASGTILCPRESGIMCCDRSGVGHYASG